jgi:hypothetical protein
LYDYAALIVPTRATAMVATQNKLINQPTETRDYLLPKLISGDVKLSNKDVE